MTVQLTPVSMVIPGQRNPYAGVYYELPVQVWQMSMTFGVLTPAQKRKLQGFLASLDGPTRTFTIPDWDYDYDTAVRGIGGGATGSITATGAANANTVTLGSVGGSAPQFRAGDRFGSLGSIYMIAEDATFTGSGSVSVRPRLRSALSGAQALRTGLAFNMRLLDDAQTAFEIAASGNASKPLTLVEAF